MTLEEYKQKVTDLNDKLDKLKEDFVSENGDFRIGDIVVYFDGEKTGKIKYRIENTWINLKYGLMYELAEWDDEENDYVSKTDNDMYFGSELRLYNGVHSVENIEYGEWYKCNGGLMPEDFYDVDISDTDIVLRDEENGLYVDNRFIDETTGEYKWKRGNYITINNYVEWMIPKP